MLVESLLIFKFHTQNDINQWRVVDDAVMGGKSQGSISYRKEGYGLFSGEVSLANNGGFSSVHHAFQPKPIKGYTYIAIKVKGNGKRYQLRLRENPNEPQAYITTFNTSGEWETLRFKLADFYPTFRGRRLNIPNFGAEQLCEVAFLIADKQRGNFTLCIDSIALERL